MRISNLPAGTKLMWDAPPIGDWYNGGRRITYPATIGEKHGASRSPQNGWVKVYTSGNSSWMGPEEEHLRLPTEEELKTLTWPEPK